MRESTVGNLNNNILDTAANHKDSIQKLISKVCCCICDESIFHSSQDTPEIDLAVYQEMWFPVAVVAGVTVILIFLAIVCLVSHSIPTLVSNILSHLTVTHSAGSCYEIHSVGQPYILL